MSMAAFDTLQFAQTLREKAKLTIEQAEGISEAFADATSDQMVTKSYLDTKLKEMQLTIGSMIVALGGILIAIKFLGH
jgi:predicted secreted protein